MKEDMQPPKDLQLVGKEVAIVWDDGKEDFIRVDFLRAHSPSAENVGERDILGNQYGGAQPGQDYSGVSIQNWLYVGNYAVQFHFSDGHNTGLYSWPYLQKLAKKQCKDLS